MFKILVVEDDKDLNKISNDEFSIDDLQEEINNGILIKTQKWS